MRPESACCSNSAGAKQTFRRNRVSSAIPDSHLWLGQSCDEKLRIQPLRPEDVETIHLSIPLPSTLPMRVWPARLKRTPRLTRRTSFVRGSCHKPPMSRRVDLGLRLRPVDARFHPRPAASRKPHVLPCGGPYSPPPGQKLRAPRRERRYPSGDGSRPCQDVWRLRFQCTKRRTVGLLPRFGAEPSPESPGGGIGWG